MNTTRKLLLNSKGFETKLGTLQIRTKCLELNMEDFANKSIFVVSLPSYEVDERIVNNCVEILGFKRENIYLSADGIPKETMIPDVIYVTAGNTFEVLQYMRDFGLVDYIKDMFKKSENLIYIGSSAGAMIAGTDIKLALDMDSNFVRMVDFTALDLFVGTIIPHFKPEELERYKAEKEESVLEEYPMIYSVSNEEVLVLDAKLKFLTGEI